MIILNEDKTECVIVREDGTIFVLDETEIYEIFGEIKKHDYDTSINHVIQQTMDYRKLRRNQSNNSRSHKKDRNRVNFSDR